MNKTLLSTVAVIAALTYGTASANPLSLELDAKTTKDTPIVNTTGYSAAVLLKLGTTPFKVGVGVQQGVIDSTKEVAVLGADYGRVSLRLSGNDDSVKGKATLLVAPKVHVYASLKEDNGTLDYNLGGVTVAVPVHEKTALVGAQYTLWNTSKTNIRFSAGAGKTNLRGGGKSATGNYGTVGLSVTFK